MNTPRDPSANLARLIVEAKAGSQAASGELLEHYRPLMLQIANEELGKRLKPKLGASDLVQDTCLEAGKSFIQFRGHDPRQLASWLVEILRNNLADQQRFFASKKRNVKREHRSRFDSSIGRRLNQQPDPASETSPSSHASRKESLSLIELALNTLPDLSRNVLILRSRDRLSFAEIGIQIGRSADATRKIWSRAIESLQKSDAVIGIGKHDRR